MTFTDEEIDEAVSQTIADTECVSELDANPDIKKMILERMAIGVKRYGHGIRVWDDTTEWGTKDDSWLEMALEEALDMAIYLASAILRLRSLNKKL